MRVLAIETTDFTGSVALLQNGNGLHSLELPLLSRSAATLAPAIKNLLLQASWEPSELDLIAVATGPGSFTGLRVGVATAKILAYSIGAEIIGINTLDAIASQTPASIEKVWAAIDAQRQQVFVRQYVRLHSDQWKAITPTHILDNARWLSELTPDSAATGTALAKLKTQLPANVVAVDESLWRPRAETVGKLAWQRFSTGHRDNLWTIVPEYFRRSAAEEKLDKKNTAD